MPQLQLPIFPQGMSHLTPELGFVCRDGVVTYFAGLLPVFTHAAEDVATFRMITSQFIVNGNARNGDVARAFGIPLVSVKRAVHRYREGGPSAFYAPRKSRGAAVLTAGVMEQIQDLLDAGETPADPARALGLKPNTVAKAVRAGRLRAKKS